MSCSNPYWKYLERALAAGCPLTLKRGHLSSVATQQNIHKAKHQINYSAIEQRFQVEFSDKWFLTSVEAYLNSDPSLACIKERVDIGELSDVCNDLLGQYPYLYFRLRIMEACLADQYDRTLFCVLMVAIECEISQREEKQKPGIFLVALTHDVGLLNIEYDKVNTNVEHIPLFDAENDYIKHVDFAVEFAVAQDFPKDVVRGIKEHHERLDGTGYPNNLAGVRLSEFGQHIHLYDTLYSIYVQKFRPLNKSLGDLKPIIEMNSVTHFGQVAASIITFIDSVPGSKSMIASEQEYERILSDAREMRVFVQSSLAICQAFTQKVGFRHDDKKLLSLQNGFFHIALAVHKSKGNTGVLQFIDTAVIDEASAEKYKTLENVYIMLREICYHIDIYIRQLRSYRNTTKNTIIITAIEKTLDEFKQTNRLGHD